MRLSTIKIIIGFITATVSFLSCKKQEVALGRPVGLSVFNGLDNGIRLLGNYSDVHPIVYARGQSLLNGSAIVSYFQSPAVRVRYFVPPDTLAKDNPVFDKQLDLEAGKSYSLYLASGSTEVDHLLVNNQFKGYKEGDSVTYLQVVNISNDQPVSVNIKGNPAGSFINSLAYKGASDFIEVKTGKDRPVYEFEFRDVATGELLLTDPVPELKNGASGVSDFTYKNWTIVFKGKRGVTGTDAIGAKRVYYTK
jgi:hypothetical protein